MRRRRARRWGEGCGSAFLFRFPVLILPAHLQPQTAGGRGMPGCRISACGPGAQEGTAEPGSPPPPREPMPFSQPPPPTPTLTPTPTPGQSPPLPDAAGTSAGAAEGQELQRWRQGASGVAGLAGPGGGSGAAAGTGGRALELAEARRRLLEVEGRRRLVSELESRVLQLHRVFLAAELRLAHRAESLSRLSGGVAQAELYLAAHGSRLKKGPRRGRRGRPPALLASALGLGGCVPWGAGRLRRGHGPEPDSPFRRSPPRGPASPQR
ncbi:TMF-regulated nuclear protein 1 [Chlorocebus sabaeus]